MDIVSENKKNRALKQNWKKKSVLNFVFLLCISIEIEVLCNRLKYNT